MSKRRILVFIFLVLLEIFYSSVYISEHKRPLEILEFQKDGKPIEDADEIPQEAKALMEEYREAKQSELLYIKVSRIMSVFVLVSLVICYIRNDKTEKQKKIGYHKVVNFIYERRNGYEEKSNHSSYYNWNGIIRFTPRLRCTVEAGQYGLVV